MRFRFRPRFLTARVPPRHAGRLLAVVAMAALLAGSGCDRNDRPQQLGTPAPQFTVTDAQHTVSLAQMRGHVVLLNFWASWCGPCLEELPSLEALHHSMPDLNILGVSIDEDTSAYSRFLVAHKVDFPTVVDPTQHSNGLYGTFRPPETFVIDRNGIIRRKFIGPQDWTSPEIVNFLRRLQRS